MTRDIERRNFVFTVFEGAFYVAGASLISAQTVLPALVERLGGGNIAVGMLGLITWGGVYLPQILASRIGQTLRWKKPWVIKFGGLQRLMVFVIGILLLVTSDAHPVLTLPVFLLLFLLNQLIIGMTSPVWFDFFAKVIARKFRGRLAGYRSALAGLMSLGGTVLLSVLLTAFRFPWNFAAIALTAFLFEAVSLTLQNLIIETAPSGVHPRRSFPEYVAQLREILRENREFRRFLSAAALLVTSAMPVGFFTVYAFRQFHLDVQVVGSFTLLMVVGQIIGAVAIGYLADLKSNKSALLASYSALLLATFTALLAPSYDWFRLVFVFVGMNLGSEMMVRYSMAIEYGAPELRSTYIGIMNTLLAPCYAATMLGGLLSDYLGYEALFIAGILVSCVGLYYLAANVNEPHVPHHITPSLVRQEEAIDAEEVEGEENAEIMDPAGLSSGEAHSSRHSLN